jgi:hypothetical protein
MSLQLQKTALQMVVDGMRWCRSKRGPNHVPITQWCSKDCRDDYHLNSPDL